MPADCAYCGQAVDGDGFICSRCAGSTQAPLQYSFEHMQHPTTGVHPDSGSTVERPEVEVRDNLASGPDKQLKKLDQKPARTAAEETNSDTRTRLESKKSKKSKKEEFKEAERKIFEEKKRNKNSSKEWKKQKIHQDFTARTRAIKVVIQTAIVIVLMLTVFQCFESNQPLLGAIVFAVAGVILLLIGFIFSVVLFFRNTPWTRFATYIYDHRPPQECQVKLISVRPPYTVGELVVINQSGKQERRSRFRVVHTNANPALFMRSIESTRLPDDMFSGSIRRGSTEGLEAAIVTIGDCRFWCVPD